MATRSSVLAWRIPGTGEPGGLPSMGLCRVGHDWSNLAALTPRTCSNSYPLSRWCHPTISCSVIPLSCLQSFPASGSFQMSQLSASDGQSIGVSASASVLPINTRLISFRMDWLDLLAVQGTLQHHRSKASTLWCSAFFIVQLSHPYMTSGKIIALTRRTSK